MWHWESNASNIYIAWTLYCLDIDRLQHGYINILILMTNITLFNLHGNLGKFYKKIQKLHNLKKIGSQI